MWAVLGLFGQCEEFTHLYLSSDTDVRFVYSLTPHIDSLAQNNLPVLKAFSLELYKARGTFGMVTEDEHAVLRDMIKQLVKAITARTSFPFEATYSYGRAPLTNAMDMIKFCFSFGDESLSLCEGVTRHLQPSDKAKVARWFTSWLPAFVVELQQVLKEKGLTVTAEPFRTFLSRGIRSYAAVGVGKKPAEHQPSSRLSSFGCGCEHCQSMKKFIRSSAQVESLSLHGTHRTHLEKELKSAGAADAGLKWKTVNSGRPYRLEVRQFCFAVESS